MKYTDKELCALAIEGMSRSYSPYSGCKVGAALLARSGKVYLGCNVENAAYSPTICAERVAFMKAVSEGEREFDAIAIVGGVNGEIKGIFPPCGVCRQVMAEFCNPDDFRILMVKGPDTYESVTLGELLPYGFDKSKL